ncbi:hypothetical protein RI367_003621 [Sorochytrium milnesiophthora]
MVLRIRLARLGGRNDPFYRIVVANAKARRDGKHIEPLGTYDPIPTQHGVKNVEMNMERVKYWLSVGAQPTKTVEILLGKAGIVPLVNRFSSQQRPQPRQQQQQQQLPPASNKSAVQRVM